MKTAIRDACGGARTSVRAVTAFFLTAAFALTTRGVDAPAKKDGFSADARKWASVVEWIGFWEASETRTHKYRSSLNASLWSDSLQDAQTSSQFRLSRNSGGPGTWDPANGYFE